MPRDRQIGALRDKQPQIPRTSVWSRIHLLPILGIFDEWLPNRQHPYWPVALVARTRAPMIA